MLIVLGECVTMKRNMRRYNCQFGHNFCIEVEN